MRPMPRLGFMFSAFRPSRGCRSGRGLPLACLELAPVFVSAAKNHERFVVAQTDANARLPPRLRSISSTNSDVLDASTKL